MAETRVRLLNTTDKMLRLRYGGEPIVFHPHGMSGSVLALPPAVAAYVKGQLLDQVEEIAAAVSISYVDHQKVDRFYLANFSGDPDSPEFFEAKFTALNGELATKRIRNELHEPRIFKARLGRESKIVDPGAHEYIDAQTGKKMRNTRPMQVTYPGKMVVIPPYTVVEVTKGQWQSILSQEYDKPDDYPRFIRVAREPSSFEPNYNDAWWTLNRLRSYLEMMPETNEREAGVAVMGDTEEERRALLKEAGVDEDAIDLRIEADRFELFARAKIRAMDITYTLPTKAEFDAHVARRAKSDKNQKV